MSNTLLNPAHRDSELSVTIRILIADDHDILRDGLVSLLQNEDDFEVIGTARDGREAVKTVLEIKPDVVLMDVGMKNLNGIDATRQITTRSPGTKVIGLSMHTNRQFVTGMMEAGAAGYLVKSSDYSELVREIRTAVEGNTYLSSKVAGTVVDAWLGGSGSPPHARTVSLTPREREVLQLISEGKTTKEIGGILHISDKTVESHRQNLMQKLDIHSIAELTRYAIEIGVTPLDG